MRALVIALFLFLAVWHLSTASSLLAGGGVVTFLENHAGEIRQQIAQWNALSPHRGDAHRSPPHPDRPAQRGTALLLSGSLALLSAMLLGLAGLLLFLRRGRVLALVATVAAVASEGALFWALGSEPAIVVGGLLRLSLLATCAILLVTSLGHELWEFR